MKENWDKAINFVIDIEGGWVNDVLDPGGETKYGISKRAYPTLEISTLTEEDAKSIYKRDYWDACNCDHLSTGIDMVVFDCAVNMGVPTAKLMLQTSPTWQDLMLRRIDRYIEISRKNANLQKFFRGWIIRCIRLSKLIRG
jgi:lysozyme family protein